MTTQEEIDFGEAFLDNLLNNATTAGIIAPQLTVSSVFTIASTLATRAGAPAFFSAAQEIFGATSNTIIGGSDFW